MANFILLSSSLLLCSIVFWSYLFEFVSNMPSQFRSSKSSNSAVEPVFTDRIDGLYGKRCYNWSKASVALGPIRMNNFVFFRLYFLMNYLLSSTYFSVKSLSSHTTNTFPPRILKVVFNNSIFDCLLVYYSNLSTVKI